MNFTESVYYVISILMMLAGMVLACVQIVFSLEMGATLGAFVLLAVSLLFMLLACRKKDECPPAFDFSKKKMNVYSFFVAGGFIAEMVCSLLGIYEYYEGESVDYGGIILLALSALTALFSAFAFVLIGISFGGTNHDFRRIPYIAFMPLLWAMTRIAQSLTEYIRFGEDLTSTLKVVALLFILLFFYRFAFESLKGEKAAKSTLFFSGAVFIAGFMFFVSYNASFISQQENVNVLDFGLMLTVFLVSNFAIHFRRSIIDRC